MKNKTDRRNFLKNVSMGTFTAGMIPSALIANDLHPHSVDPGVESGKQPSSKHAFNKSYSGEYLNRVAFPIGGMGAGMFCMEGTGTISHMSVRNKPDVFNEPGIFAGIYLKGIPNGAKILEGPVPDWKKFGRPGSGNGSGEGTPIGLPRFHHAQFTPKFPFADLDLTDDELPISVRITGWSPFIPTDDDNSSLPAGAFEYKFTNTGTGALEAVFSFNSKNFLRVDEGKNAIRPLRNGFILSEQGTREKPFLKADFAIFTDDDSVVIDHCWFRGGWWDPVTIAWNTIKNGGVKQVDPVDTDAPGASLYIPFHLAPGAEKTIRVMMAWYVPDSDLTYGAMGKPKENCDPSSGCCTSPDVLALDKYDKNFDGKFYKPWYAAEFRNVEEVCRYWLENYHDLKSKSASFRDAFYSATLPPEVMEAVTCNLSILKSPTVLRQFDGRLWSFEGCGDDWGCCHGSCTHVWNYAQAIAHLFPALERSLRHTEFCESQNEEGHQNFRSNLPIRPADHSFYAASDGQLGGIMKTYREWKIYGDNDWVRKMYPMVQKSMDYCINTWDPRHKGVVEEPHHNTYDIEFWGPDPMCTGFYLGALNAIIAMGAFLGKDVTVYRSLAEKSRKFLEEDLFDGEYFFQKVVFKGLNAPDPAVAASKSFGGEYSEEARELLEKEGPKYQYGKGCLSDGILGAWIARMCGIPDIADADKIKSHLLAIHKYNLKKNLSDHANPQRPSYALGNEGGLLLCSWPKGGKPSLPFVYSDEVWTGIEHQVASHLILMGHVPEGLDIVRASRNRYDGRIRNPFNEYECGHWYARALSSYGYLQALTGVRFDAVEKILYIDSRIGDFTSFLSVETGFGTVTLKKGEVFVKAYYGHIPVEKALVAGEKTSFQLT